MTGIMKWYNTHRYIKPCLATALTLFGRHVLWTYQVADLGYYYDGAEVRVRVGIVGGVVVGLVTEGAWLQLMCCALV
jgi:hypothetical protein